MPYTSCAFDAKARLDDDDERRLRIITLNYPETKSRNGEEMKKQIKRYGGRCVFTQPKDYELVINQETEAVFSDCPSRQTVS